MIIYKKLVGCLVLAGSILTLSLPTPVGAVDGTGVGNACNGHFLTFPAWYNGLAKPSADGEGCDIKSPSELGGDDKTGGFAKFIWTIALNLVEILLNLVGYMSVGFIIYGGYKYIYSAGSPNGMVAARKTIMNAIIGLVLSILSVAIVNTIAGGLK